MSGPEEEQVKKMVKTKQVKVAVEITDEQVEGEDAFNLKTFTGNFSTTGPLHLVESHFWDGRAITNYPNLDIGYYAYTKQTGTLPEGIKFGLVYADGSDTTARKFVVAFDGPAGKAYAESGPVGPVDWDVVDEKLGMGEDIADYTDPILGGRCIAEVSGVNASATFRN